MNHRPLRCDHLNKNCLFLPLFLDNFAYLLYESLDRRYKAGKRVADKMRQVTHDRITNLRPLTKKKYSCAIVRHSPRPLLPKVWKRDHGLGGVDPPFFCLEGCRAAGGDSRSVF